MATTMNPMMSGARLPCTAVLSSSVTAKMNSTSNAVMLNVGTLLSSPRTIWLLSSKEPIA